MLHGFATPDGTRRYAAEFVSAQENQFFSLTNDLHVSSVGLGTDRGEPDEATDRGYEHAVMVAMQSGINFLDTAINYRGQRSERAIGSALRVLMNANVLQRDQLVLCSKAGFLTPGAIPESLQEDDIAGEVHSMAPDFLEDQLDRSRANLEMDTLDVFYLHNPETQLSFIPESLFEQRLQAAFKRLERMVDERKIRWYGASTWDGFRTPGQLDLERMVDLARYVGGDDHHFRFIQVPFNLGLIEAYQHRDQQGASLLKNAGRAGITVVASSALYQGRFAQNLPPIIADRIPGLTRDAAKAIQFTRSTPGISVALVGMSSADHVRENLEVAGVPPMGTSDYEKLYRPVDT